MGINTVQLNRAWIVDKDDEIFTLYEQYLSLITDINNPNLNEKDVSIAASNLVVAKMLQKVLRLAKE